MSTHRTITDPHWADHATCRDHDPDLWYPDLRTGGPRDHTTNQQIETATRICNRRCPVTDDCLTDALTTEAGRYENRHGIRGGLTPAQRHKLHAHNRATHNQAR